jgi:formamidopyrimidine-DNA glycosylase
MIELPEAIFLSKQLKTALVGKRITTVTAASSPHKFAWYAGDPARYGSLLAGKRITDACNIGGMVEVAAENTRILLSDGVSIRLHADTSTLAKKHQLLIGFDDDSFLCGSVQMYGGLCCFEEGGYDNKYYLVACEKPAPLSKGFTPKYFDGLVDTSGCDNLSLKALLATEQRIPGLGNGVLQDILFNARFHPKKKTGTLTDVRRKVLFDSIVRTIGEMVARGGRDTEADIYGKPGNYRTKMSRLTVGTPCVVCGTAIEKAAYMGGSVYFCPICQDI